MSWERGRKKIESSDKPQESVYAGELRRLGFEPGEREELPLSESDTAEPGHSHEHPDLDSRFTFQNRTPTFFHTGGPEPHTWAFDETGGVWIHHGAALDLTSLGFRKMEEDDSEQHVHEQPKPLN